MGLTRRDSMVVAASAGIGLSRSPAEPLAAQGGPDAFIAQSLDQARQALRAPSSSVTGWRGRTDTVWPTLVEEFR